MSRKAANKAPGISLFPFLAVLLCTMGALIVVLVVLNRQSRIEATTQAAAQNDSASAGDAELRRDTLAWELSHLEISREKTQSDLNAERLRLSGVEEHRRQLEAQLAELMRAASELENWQPGISAGAQAAAELAQVQAAIAAAREQLAALRDQAAASAPAYSVVPYDGRNRTRRRPIYIECTGERVIIQPEGIELVASDFAGPMGPGNPLASAVRAARDHIVAASPDPKSTDAEPYPLFLVRPDGIEAYYAARAAMLSWGSEFGYQTIDQDWTLDFPPADSRLADLERQAVDEARERLKWLAQLSPDRYGAGGQRRVPGGKVSYRVSPLGGLVREGGPSLGESGRGLGRAKRGGFGSRDDVSAGGQQESNDVSPQVAARPRRGANRDSNADPANASADATTTVRTAMAQRQVGSKRGTADRLTGESGLSTPDAQAGAPGSQQRAQQHDNAVASSERHYGDLNERMRSETGAPMPANAQGATRGDADSGETQTDVKLESRKEKPRSLAESRGVNWGLSPAARSSSPITRPIHILCEGDKLVIRPDRNDAMPVEVPLRLRTEDSVDLLVGGIHERINDWGIAGRGLYWRPQLVLEVGRSGEGRYADLEALLADSGFDVKRR
jgi:hypothetical protein